MFLLSEMQRRLLGWRKSNNLQSPNPKLHSTHSTRARARTIVSSASQRKKMQQGRTRSRPRIAGARPGPSSSPSRRGGSSGGEGAGRGLRLHRLPVQLAQGPRPRRRADGKRALWWRDDARVHPVTHPPSPPPPPPLDRPHTCYDVLAPDSPFASSSLLLLPPDRRTPWEEAKVVVNVTVEGSPGPVRAMVSLGSSIRDAIAAVLERYHREGRSPRLDPASADSFQLHHSHFSLQSLNKNDKMSEVGGRNFYLHKNDGSNGLVPHREQEAGVHSGGGETTESRGGQLAGVPYHHQLLAIVMKKLDKIGRRTKRIWRLLTCDCT